MPKLLIVDGNSIINRAFYAIGGLTNKDGLSTGGIYGFLTTFFKYMDEYNPEYVAVAFDLAAPTFRHLKYEQYKAQRKGMPDELAAQMPVLKEVLGAMNVAILQQEGFEADDIIGTVSAMCEKEGVTCLVATGDKDDLQLASPLTQILLTTTKSGRTQTEVFDDNAVLEKYGVTPTEFIDVKGLMGDASDNIPGVKGIGEKTAFSLISTYKSIDAVYEKLNELPLTKSVKQKLADGRDMAFFSRELATICREVPLGCSLGDLAARPADAQKLGELFSMLGFESFLKKLSLSGSPKEEIVFPEAEIIDDESLLFAALEKVENEFVYHIYRYGAEAVAVGFLAGGTPYLAKLGLFLPISLFAPVFENAAVAKTGLAIKEDIALLKDYGIRLKNIGCDLAIGAYILDPARTAYTPDGLARSFLGLSILGEEQVLGKGKSKLGLLDAGEQTIKELCGQTLFVLPRLKDYILSEIEKNGQHDLFYNVEMPLVRVLANMEEQGFMVDKAQLAAFSKKLGEEISGLEKTIYDLAEEEFNINSTQQLGKILFEKLGLPVVKKTKTGYSTDSDVLEKLSGKHPIIEHLVSYRQLMKLKSTYADGLQQVISPKTGKIHSTFNQTVTTTGRISSTEPNLQNIPVRLALGREVRKMFTASSGDYVLVDADYSQIELRVLAHISGDEAMKAAFFGGTDIHTVTASQVFHVPIDMVTPQMRSAAKAVNFGIVYGIGDFSLAQDLKITRKEAKAYIDSYLAKYIGVKEYMDKTVAEATKCGYVTTLLGRRRYLPELASQNYNLRSFGQRAAMNAPIQGSAADIIKIAMVKVAKSLAEKTKKSHLILQVHDELIVEAHKDEVETVKALVLSEMQNAYPLSVPLVADLSCGHSWYDAK